MDNRIVNSITDDNAAAHKTIGAKLTGYETQLFKEFCAARGENVSSVLRRFILTELAVHSFLNEHRKKALGVK